MPKPLHQFIFLLLLPFAALPAHYALAQTPASTTAVVDAEYERYKKQGDDFFKAGEYLSARRQYQNCLEVPGFDNDVYAKGQINKCAVGLTMSQQADSTKRQEKNPEALRLYGELLKLNPDDALTKTQLTDLYEREGNKLFNQKQYLVAKTNYTEALRYATATKKETLSIQIENIDRILNTPPPPPPKPSKRVGLKLFTGAVAVGAGAYAFLLRDDYQSKMGALSQISQTFDPNNTGVIDNPDNYQQYAGAYAAAEAAQRKNGLFKACVGVAAVAAVAELYLLIRKPKVKSRVSTLRWKPASQSWGLAASYIF